MSTGSSLKAHRKQVVTHTSIVVAFVLFLVFVSEPLFDRLEAVEGESRLCDFPLPPETGGIRYYFDDFMTDRYSIARINGWAFIDGYDSVNPEIYIVLKSADRTYIFTAETILREDVTRHFQQLGLNLDYSGFTAVIPARKIADGEYAVGIYITNGDIAAVQYTDRSVIKSKDTVQLSG